MKIKFAHESDFQTLSFLLEKYLLKFHTPIKIYSKECPLNEFQHDVQPKKTCHEVLWMCETGGANVWKSLSIPNTWTHSVIPQNQALWHFRYLEPSYLFWLPRLRESHVGRESIHVCWESNVIIIQSVVGMGKHIWIMNKQRLIFVQIPCQRYTDVI